MSNFLARCALLGLVGAGFAATGDLAWLAARGLQLVNAASIPDSHHAAEPAIRATPGADAPRQVEAAHAPSLPRPAASLESSQPPAAGPERIDIAALRVGERTTFWFGRPAVTGRCLSFDLVDPAAGEALLLAPGMPARRVVIRPARAGQGTVVSQGDSLLVTPVGPAREGRPCGETIGPITAIAVGR